MIDVSKLPPGPWAKYHDGVIDPDSQWIASIEEKPPAQTEAIAALLIWARAIIEPPAGVKEAMERIRKGEYVTYWTGPTQYGSGQLEPKYFEDRATVANWTLKIFEGVK